MIRVALVGFGMAGRVFHAPLLSSVEGLELAAVVERNSNNAIKRYPGIAVYRSLKEMLADASLGLFVVATPNGTHFEIAKEILSAGKNVVVDKPMTLTSAEAAELIELAKRSGKLLSPFQNRRWESDFLTIQKVLREETIGRLVCFEARYDRWRPHPYKDKVWKESVDAGGGVLFDLGSHLADQALLLLGKPEAVSADIRREKGGPGTNDSFNIRLRYPNLTAILEANHLTLPADSRFQLRGTRGGYVKSGSDPQEAALNKITRINDPRWGEEPQEEWGILNIDIDGGTVRRPVPGIPGDYRLYYAGIRDALLGKSALPVAGVDGWRVARLLEYAQQSSDERCELKCDWSQEPK